MPRYKKEVDLVYGAMEDSLAESAVQEIFFEQLTTCQARIKARFEIVYSIAHKPSSEQVAEIALKRPDLVPNLRAYLLARRQKLQAIERDNLHDAEQIVHWAREISKSARVGYVARQEFARLTGVKGALGDPELPEVAERFVDYARERGNPQAAGLVVELIDERLELLDELSRQPVG